MFVIRGNKSSVAQIVVQMCSFVSLYMWASICLCFCLFVCFPSEPNWSSHMEGTNKHICTTIHTTDDLFPLFFRSDFWLKMNKQSEFQISKENWNPLQFSILLKHSQHRFNGFIKALWVGLEFFSKLYSLVYTLVVTHPDHKI